MLFNSIDFLIFFPIVVLIYYLIPRKLKYIWLLIASYYFYMSWNAKYVALLLFSTLITYLSGILLGRSSSLLKKRLIVALSLLANLSVLGFFKYFDFFLHNLNKILAIVHIRVIDNPFSFLLPVGISFYTFQALSYTLDVYRGKAEPEKNLLKYALFVSFFPQLVAGPIEKTENLLKQINESCKKRMFSFDKLVSGFALMLWGFFLKMVIADRISLFVDGVFGELYRMGTVETVLAAIAFAIQIYGDFAGYSTIAVGAARMMGFELTDNFNAPYFADSVGDFWRRWHISLSAWFRDYLYIPLGGNRKGKLRKYCNLMITFSVSGLWHGAAWTYIIWGGIHGLYQIIGDLLKPLREKAVDLLKIKTDVFSYRFGKVITTFALVDLAWVFFRAESIKQAGLFFNRMFTRFNPWVLFDDSLFLYGINQKEWGILAAALLVLFVVDLLRYRKHINIGDFLLRQNLWFRYAALFLLIVSVLVYGEYGIHFDSRQFIYFQF
ncbi:MAG: MBOAT family protein [Roseburia sp.]|nr:MBOAT family protein [Roseburia sp.]MCM1096860.1 MBOAT family protein [Ruminococcus flavefaciens]